MLTRKSNSQHQPLNFRQTCPPMGINITSPSKRIHFSVQQKKKAQQTPVTPCFSIPEYTFVGKSRRLESKALYCPLPGTPSSNMHTPYSFPFYPIRRLELICCLNFWLSCGTAGISDILAELSDSSWLASGDASTLALGSFAAFVVLLDGGGALAAPYSLPSSSSSRRRYAFALAL